MVEYDQRSLYSGKVRPVRTASSSAKAVIRGAGRRSGSGAHSTVGVSVCSSIATPPLAGGILTQAVR